MSNEQACMDVINPLLQAEAAENAQFPLWLFSGPNCTGTRYPPEGEFNLWGQYLDFATFGFNEVRSAYVPPQALLELWATGDEGYFSVTGPSVLPDLRAQLGFWRNWDDSPCLSNQVNCGNRVVWTLNNPVAKMRISLPVNWNLTLANLAAQKETLSVSGFTYEIDNDALYGELCYEGQTRVPCNCFNSYQQILANHATSATNSFINVLQEGCDPLGQYVPTGALVGEVTPVECQRQIQAQLENGTFPTLDRGGPEIYICAGKSYVNTNSDGSFDRLARFDDDEDDKLELQEMSNSNSSNTGWWIMGGLLIFAALLLVFYFLVLRHRLDPHIARAKIKKKKKMHGYSS